jgi:acyl-CoA thioester hydrolase
VARIDRKRLDGARFPVITTIATRYDDMDPQGHINNAAAAVILQEARVDLNRAARLPQMESELRTVVASLHIEYAGEMYHPQPIEVATGILALGRTSLTFGQVARQGGRTTLYAETVIVMTDEIGPIEISGALREAFAKLALADG